MSSKRDNPPSSPLCRFTFADGRRCKSLARPDFDGLCFHHGTFRPRASRQDNLTRELAPLATGSLEPAEISHGLHALGRACKEQRVPPQSLGVLTQLASLIRSARRTSLADDPPASTPMAHNPFVSATSTSPSRKPSKSNGFGR